ncbi:MAG: glycosyltransferase, partial [Planctomycetota bacterium]|nr:glycosyltransferase [Planctomycetota bacterium]
MLRIGMLCHSSLGGSSRVAIELARSLAQKGLETQVFSNTPLVLPLSEHPKLSSVSLHSQKAEDQDPGALQAHWSEDQRDRFSQMICQRLRKNPVDVLHFHYALPFVHIAKRVRAIMGRAAPAIVGTLHGTDVTQFSGKPSSAATLVKCLNETVDVLTTVSVAHGRLAQELFPGLHQPVTIPNFIDAQRFRPQPRSPSGPKILVHASNYRAVKGPLEMARIFLGVRSKLDVKLQLLGTGRELQAT